MIPLAQFYRLVGIMENSSVSLTHWFLIFNFDRMGEVSPCALNLKPNTPL